MAIKLLTYTTLFPNNQHPHHGIFVENRLKHLLRCCDVESRVIAPVPWFPFRYKKFGRFSTYARVERCAQRNGVKILHPRYPVIPMVGMYCTPLFLALATLVTLKRVLREGYNFDVIDAHYYYPDGVAAAMLGKLLKKPVVITARGTDINFIPKHYFARRMILWAAEQAAATITVCMALKNELIKLGADENKITALRNGVDLDMFQPAKNRKNERIKLNIQGKTILSVGHLIDRKGHDIVIKALSCLPGVSLLIAGSGPDEMLLRKLSVELDIGERVTFLGSVPHQKLPQYYNAADITVLASSREGWANVLLESIACGTPVVATDIWGTSEVITCPEAGRLISDRTERSLAAAIKEVFDNYPNRWATRKFAERYSWDATSQGQHSIFKRILSSTKA